MAGLCLSNTHRCCTVSLPTAFDHPLPPSDEKHYGINNINRGYSSKHTNVLHHRLIGRPGRQGMLCLYVKSPNSGDMHVRDVRKSRRGAEGDRCLRAIMSETTTRISLLILPQHLTVISKVLVHLINHHMIRLLRQNVHLITLLIIKHCLLIVI